MTYIVELKHVRSKKRFWAEIERGIPVPDYFGENLDALNASLRALDQYGDELERLLDAFRDPGAYLFVAPDFHPVHYHLHAMLPPPVNVRNLVERVDHSIDADPHKTAAAQLPVVNPSRSSFMSSLSAVCIPPV